MELIVMTDLGIMILTGFGIKTGLILRIIRPLGSTLLALRI